MKIKIINPNSTSEFTENIRICAERYKRIDCEVICVNPANSPTSIEGFYDEALAVPHVLEEIRRGNEEEGVDGFVIACFGDPGLYAAREITNKPVMGIAEAAFHLASIIGACFSIVTSAPRMRVMTEHLLTRYGFASQCRSVRTTSIHVLDLCHDPIVAVNNVINECYRARDEDLAEVIVLGCAGMAQFRDEIEQSVGIPVIDGTVAALKMCEAMIDMGLKTSKHLTFDFPITTNTKTNTHNENK